MILDVWRTAMCQILAGETVALPGFTMIGNGNTPVDKTDVALDNELSRKAITTVSRPTRFSVRYESIWSSAEQNSISFKEAGMINASPGGTIANRILFPAFEKQDTFELRVQTEIKIEDA